MNILQMEKKVNYSIFLEELAETIKEKSSIELITEQTEVTKNNAVVYRGLLVKEKDSSIAPTFYLEEQFSKFESGEKSLDEVAEYVLECYAKERRKKQELLEHLDFCWDGMKEFITYRLVNREKNQKMLCRAPYEEFLDLALVYQYTLDISDGVQGTIQILKEHLELLNITEEELRAVAFENTRRMHPPVIYSIEEVLLHTKQEWNGEKINTKPESGLYVLTNRSGVYGAVSILFTDELKRFAQATGGGFFILPSSIHEVIFVPDAPGVSLEFLLSSVRSINETTVAATEVLSNQVYYFDPEDGNIRRLGEEPAGEESAGEEPAGEEPAMEVI